MRLCDGSSPLRRLVRRRSCRWPHKPKCAVEADVHHSVGAGGYQLHHTSVPRLLQDILLPRVHASMADFPAEAFAPIDPSHRRVVRLSARHEYALVPRGLVSVVIAASLTVTGASGIFAASTAHSSSPADAFTGGSSAAFPAGTFSSTTRLSGDTHRTTRTTHLGTTLIRTTPILTTPTLRRSNPWRPTTAIAIMSS